jgi:hypothetical protein
MRWRWFLWLVYLGVWTWALLVPDPGAWARFLLGLPAAAEPAELPDWRAQLLRMLLSFWFSKGLHVAGYLVLTALSAGLTVPARFRWLLLAFLSAHALGTEFLQGFEATRHPSWRDVGLDHLGIILGLVLTWKSWIDKPREETAN